MDEQQFDAEQERVRRLLAAASPPGDTELPEDVATRLDDVLASLVSERRKGHSDAGPADAAAEADPPGAEAPEEPAPAPTPIDSRRRHRWPQLLVAAAAVSVLALGIGNLTGHLTGGGGSAQHASTADSAGGAAVPRGSEGSAGSPEQKSGPGLGAALPRLRTRSIGVDAQRVEDLGLAMPVADTRDAWRRACVRPAVGPRDEWLAVRLDDVPAVLVLRAPEGGRRTADVFTCGDATSPAVSTTVQAR